MHDPPQEVREEDDLLSGEELKLFQSVVARFNFPCYAQARHLLLGKRIDAKNGFSSQTRPRYPQESCTIHKYPRRTCRYPWTELDSNIEVFGDVNFAGCNSTRKSTVGGVAMWSGQVVKALSKTQGVLTLSSGESELAVVVRAATEGMGRQSILTNFCLCCTVATAAIGPQRRPNQVPWAGISVAPHESVQLGPCR